MQSLIKRAMARLPLIVLVGLPLLTILKTSIVQPLWYDEIYTESIVATGSIRGIWDSLAHGTDLNPPLSYILVRGFFLLFGTSPLSIRLPSVLGYVLMIACLYRIARSWFSRPYAFLAMTFPLVTRAIYYASEGRPYALTLGFSSFTLLCWLRAAERGERRWPLVGMVFGIATSISTHYFAIQIIVPLAVGEFARTLERRKVDYAIWVAMLIGLLPLVWFIPLMRECRSYADSFWSKPSWALLFEFNYRMLKASSAFFAFWFACIALRGLAPVAPRASASHASAFRVHVLAAVIAWAFLPIVAIGMAKTLGSGYTDRYAIVAIIGIALLVTIVSHRVLQGNEFVAYVLVIGLCILFLSIFASLGFVNRSRIAYPRANLTSFLKDENHFEDFPVVMLDPIFYLEMVHDLPREFGDRLIFLGDPNTTESRALKNLSRLIPLQVFDQSTIKDGRKRLIVCSNIWLSAGNKAMAELVNEGARASLGKGYPGLDMFEVILP